MKQLFTLIALVSLTFGFAQDFKQEWKEVIQLELDGKVKSAQEKVGLIYKRAKRKKYDDQIIRCFFYQSKFTQVTDENAQDIILSNLKQEIRDSKGCKKALLNYVYASILKSYLSYYNYNVKNRTTIKKNDEKDWKTWTAYDFDKEIKCLFQDLLKDEKQLRETNIKEFADIMEISPYTDAKNLSVYDFLLEKKLNYLFENTYPSSTERSEKTRKELFKKSEDFIRFKTDTIPETGFKYIIELMQDNEKYCLKNNNTDIHVLQYDRMKRFTRYFDEDAYYYSKIDELILDTKNNYLLQDLRVDKAKYLYSLTRKRGDKYYYPEVLKIIENVLSTNENINAKSDAEDIKQNILGKKLVLNIPSQLYQNQNYRAYIEYKNIDSIKVSYYKINNRISDLLDKNQYYRNHDKNIYEKDSIVQDFTKKHQPIKTSLKLLPVKTDHFGYSSEVLMDNLDVGNYLLLFETSNPLGYEGLKPLAYHLIHVSNIDYVHQPLNGQDTFQVLNRKTGQPLENILVKNDVETHTTNKKGIVAFQGQNDYSRNSEIIFMAANDTLQKYYYKTNLNNDDQEEKFDAKAMVFFDRAIYRPGQKVYFKGFMFKNVNKVKSVVPNLTVHVRIVNANEDDAKEFDIQTNEFGSFTGEYEIPKNVLTGDFYVKIEEPDNYEQDTQYYNKKKEEHSFWDYAEYNDYKSFSFKVEEYKRPTFEIKFDQIKENYTFGDSLKITGNAKTFAGSNLTGAKVSYAVSKINRDIGGNYFDPETDFISKETTTDENGNFKIEFVANEEDNRLKESEFIDYKIKVTITDTNGETRTNESDINVSRKMLKLSGSIGNKINRENPDLFKIKATTFNNFPITTKGTLTLYKINQNDFLIKRTKYSDESTIGRSQFEALFPYEAYDKKDTEPKESKVLTLPFDTGKSDFVALDFLKKMEFGNYKIVLEAKDVKGNEIKSANEFELNSKTNNQFNKNEFFTYTLLGEKNDAFVFEIKSVIPDLYITSRIFFGKEKKSETVVQLKNGIGTITIPKSINTTDDINILFSTIWENNFEEKSHTISSEIIQPKLEFEVRSMRNKLEPGSNENWSFIVKNSKLQSEVLASMYDSSLDQFATSDWVFDNFYNDIYRPNINYDKDYFYDNNIFFNNLDFYSKYYPVKNSEPMLNWFGFDFNSRNGNGNKQYLEKYGPIAKVPKSAKTIYGTVSDNSGPLPGANVVVKGTNRNTQTDFDGHYEIDAEKGELLIFSFVGMMDTALKIDSQKNINVVLKSDKLELNEVVVTGYGFQQKKAKLAYSIVTVSAQTIFNRPNANMLETLKGSLNGLSWSENNRVLIRGIGSLNANSQPLYVIDGVPMSQEELLKLNPDDLQEISVLKDDQAKAIYGNRSSNGVILITTKKGVKELEQVKTRTNFNETAFFYPQLTTDEKGQINFNFTTPESLTKWKLRLLAHNKNAQSGYFQTDIISQKDIMLMPNMPRFVREKDTIVFNVKVVNMTTENKTGNAILLLYDAATNNPIDAVTLNQNNIKPYSCGSKQSVIVSWTITIPEGIQGLRYKVIAKSGNISDGEENILPVLSNKILVTESIPIWVRGNTKHEFTFTNLKNNTSTSLQNQALTVEYTSNPVWIALQSLPYLMNYPYECAEQTFAKYYGNCIAENILNQNPKVAALFDKWKNTKLPESKLKLNEELKSIVLEETPWLMDAETEAQKNQRLALLMDLNAIRENNQKALERLESLILPSGGFPWFGGGYENRYISQHILSGIGHLNKLFPNDSRKYKNIVSKGIPNLDNQFQNYYNKLKKYQRPSTADLNYLYTRSFFLKEYPTGKKLDSIVKVQLSYCKTNWLDYSLYEKGLLALIMNRYDEKDFAKKIITSLKESVSSNEEIGMYWINNYNGYYWYESQIETQALLIEAFAEIDSNKEMIDAMKVWLIKNKQTNNWPTTKSTTEAIYALLNYGTDWTSIRENTKIKIGDEKILTRKLMQKDDEMDAGYLKLSYDGKEINPKMGTISVENKTKVPGFGGVYWQYFETLEHIKVDTTKTLSIDKKLFKKLKDSKGSDELIAWNSEPLKVGDLVTVRIIIKTDNDLEFVHLKDLRASCLEPVDVLSGYNWRDNLSYYKSTRDLATNFFFDYIKKGTYVLEYDLRVTNQGTFNSGISTLQSMYSPEYATHSLNTKITVSQ